jgi:hypothetical protein
MKTKFTIEKNYNISIVAEGLDVNEAEVDFCLILDDFKIAIPLKNIKENVFRLRLPSKIKNTLKGIKEINYSINVRNDNLIFEVAKAKFELEMLTVKSVEISEALDNAEDIIIEHNTIKIDPVEEIEPPKPQIKENPKTKQTLVQQLITEIATKNKHLE